MNVTYLINGYKLLLKAAACLLIQLIFSLNSFSQGPNPKVGLQVGGNKNPNALCENDTIQLINLTKDSAKTIVYYVFNYNFKKDAAYPNYTDTFKGKDTAYHIYKFHDSVALKNCKKNSVKIYVSLTAHDKYGDDYEIITNITLFFRPRARFSGNSPVCVGKEVTFSNYSCPKDSVKFLWEIDGKTYSTYDIKYTFNKAGRYKVKLTVTSGKPCNYSDSAIQYIDVYDYPKPDFKFQTLRKNGVICFGKDTLMIINTSKTYTSIRWQIEKYDTNSFKLVKGSHLGSDTVYFVPKKTMTFWAKLTAYNGVCQDTARRKYFKVIVSPEMKLSTYPRCISGTSITLGKYLDTSKGVPDAFRWKLKGPNYSDSFTTLYPSQISGLKYGKYYVEIQSNGVCDSFVNRDSFFIAPPLTKPSLITFCDSKDTVFLLKKAFKSFPTGFGAKWSGSSLLKDSTFNPFKKSTGTYKFYLTDTFSNCIKDTVTIKVIPASPVYFKDSIICILKDSFLLHPSYKGLFVGKGVRKNYFIPSLADTGSHRIIYYSDTSVKCPFQDTSYITVTANIKAAFTVKTPNCLDSIYHLVNTTTAPTYRWTFSDKTTPASGKTYDKKFSSAGKFTIQLTVGKKGGCLDSITKDVIVYTKPQLKSQYTIDSSKCDSVLLNFKITTPDSAQKYDWIIGSKTYSGVSITLKQPRNVSSYYLKYKVTGKNLCGSISDSGLIRIPPKFNAGIKINGQSKSCTPFTTSFTNTTYGQVDSFRVTYGNGQTTKNSLSGMTYSNSGTKDTIFKILIKAYSKSCGLSKDSTFITVAPNLIKPTFSVNSPGCINTNLNYNNTSSDSIVSWDFGDAGTSTQQNPQHKYTKIGNYKISVIFKAKYNCTATSSKMIAIYDKPLLTKKYTIDSSKCDSVSLRFYITNPDTAQAYVWNIGSTTINGDTVNLTLPKNSKDSYITKYKVTGKNLCGTISDSGLIRIPPKINAGIKINGQSKSCTPFTTSFTNTTYGQVDSFRVFYGNGQTTKNSLSGMTYSNATAKDTIFKILIKAYSKSCGLSKDSTFITVAPNLIKPTFSVNSPGCINTNLNYNNTSSDSIVSWDFGDAGTSTQQNPQHKYTKIGNYKISVIFKAKYNCTATSSKMIAIYDKPLLTKKYTIDSSKCDSVSLRFYITNPDTAQAYVWNIGSTTINGDTVNLTLPKNSKDSYITKYKVTGKNLCGTISDSGLIRIPPKINAGIKINGQSKSCTPFTTSFTNTTYGQVDSFRVFYGNGQTTKNSLSGMTYSNATAKDTIFKILIKAYSKSCGLSKDSTFITVAPNLIKPTFSVNSPGCINTNLNYNNTSSDSIVSWDFGDAGTSTQQNPQHKYTKIGNYKISVIFKAKYNCTATSSKMIAIYDKPLLTKKYTIDSSKCDSVSLRFYITNPDTAQAYVWNIGSTTINGDTVNLTLPKNSKNSYITKYKVTGKNLCGTISDSGLIRIPPKINAGIKINGQSKSCTPFTTSFANTTYGQVDSFRVFYGNGQTTKNSLSGMTYSNATAKDTIFKILIKAYSKSCGLSKDSTFITVAPNLIKPTFSVNSPGCINTNLNYNNTSSDSIVSWDFGDAGTSTQQNPQHKYTKIGNYKISVIFKAKYNCTATSSKMIAIYDKPLLTKKYTIDSSKCDSVSLRFYITNPDTAQAYVWNIGSTTINGDTVNLTLPKNSKNSYITKYKVTGKNLCGTISDSGLIRIPPKINAGIKINGQSKSCTPFTTSFTNTTYGQVDSFRVTYGNGQTTKNSLSGMTYSNSGTKDTIFKILIKAYSKTCGLSKDSTFIIVAPNLINSSFNVKTPGCLDSVFYFTNSSKDSIVSWNFGDGKYSTAQNTSHKYSNVGYYAIKVAFKASFGCKDTGTKNIRVIVKPKIGLKYSIDSSHCDTNYLILNVLNYDAVNSYTWNVGSKWSSNKISDTVKIPQQFINFQIPIKLSSKNICGTDAVKDSAFIAIGFKADIVINGLTKSCSPFTPTFDNHTTGRVTSYKVYYGNGDSSVNSIKKITYYNSTDSTISYRVILKAFNPNCGYRSDTTYIFLRPNKVKPIGQYSNAVFCDKEVVTFINKSSPEAKVELQWGDGIVAYNLKYNDTIKHIYSKPGSYTTTLIAESCGVDTSKKYGIIIDKIPEVDFISIPKSLCAGQPIVFAKTSDSSYTNRWRVNGSDTANKLDSFTKIFNKPGIYKIELLVNSILNNCPNSLSKYIKIEPEPTLNFSLDYLFGCVPLQLCGHAKGNFQFLNIDWGNGKGGSKLDTCNTYLTADTFTVSVKATTFNGCFINQKSNVIVLPKPDAKYVVKIDSMPCSSIRIYGIITDPHPINKYTWTFNTNTILGDTFNFNKQKETDRKSELLNLTVSNQCGSKSFTDLISIPPDWKAILSVNGVNNGCDPFDAKFFNYTKGKVDSFTVDYGNGKKSINKITDMTYINKTGGTIIFPVVLTIFNKICPPVSDTTFITVYPNKIKLGEEHSRTKYCDGEEIFFINRSSPGAKVTFHFGDGVSVTKIYTYGDTVKHFYTKPGKYNISAVTKNPCFGDSVNLFTVDILEKPAINFSANYEPICEDFPVTFTNYTTNATNIIWVIDGLDSIRQQNQFDYKFKLFGQHTVKLIAESISTSCLNEMTKVIQVMPKPVYTLGLDTPICVGQTVCMSIGGNVKKISIDWNNNKFGSINDTCTTYMKAGYYTVNSLVESNEGCREINSKNINVHKLPTVTIYPDKDLINLDLADSIFLNFNKNQPFKKYTWYYNGDTICDDGNPICDSIKAGPFYYTTLEKFGVMLIDQFGCFATDEINIQVVSAGNYFVPNAFSPNNDGNNDLFFPIIYDPEIYSFDMRIYNRWGELLLKMDNLEPNKYGWDGVYKGVPSQMDVYMVIIQFNTKNNRYDLYKGLIHLIK